jgi:hypothetical protein
VYVCMYLYQSNRVHPNTGTTNQKSPVMPQNFGGLVVAEV